MKKNNCRLAIGVVTIVAVFGLGYAYIFHPGYWPWEPRPLRTLDDSMRAIMEGDTDILNHSRISPEDTLQKPAARPYHDDQPENIPPEDSKDLKMRAQNNEIKAAPPCPCNHKQGKITLSGSYFWLWIRDQLAWEDGGGEIMSRVIDHCPDDSIKKWIGRHTFDSLYKDWNNK